MTSFSILKDWIDVLTQNLQTFYTIETHAIVPDNADPHVYQPTPKDAKKIEGAQLILTLGLHFDDWLLKMMTNVDCVDCTDVLPATIGKTSHMTVTENISTRTDGAIDPHVWHDVTRVKIIIRNIEKALCAVLPNACNTIKQNTQSYLRKLDDLDIWIKAQINTVPQQKRKVITTHDAFYYYGDAYHVQFLSPMGVSTEIEPDSKTIANLCRLIKKEGITAIFFENLSNRNLIQQIANETNITLNDADVLYADSLFKHNGEILTYLEMMRLNTQMLVQQMNR